MIRPRPEAGRRLVETPVVPADVDPPRSRRGTHVASAVAVAVVAVVLAACGVAGAQRTVPEVTSDTVPQPKGRTAIRNLIDRAVEDTMDQRTMRFVVSTGIERPGGGEVARYRGAVDRVRREGNARVTYQGRGWLSIRALRERAYVASGDVGWRDALGGRTWLRVSTDDLVGIGTFDDLDLAATLLWRVVDRGDVRAAGTDVVGGQRLAYFRFTLPATTKRVPGSASRRVRRLTKVTSDGERSATGLVGIGRDGLIHRIRFDTVIGPPSDADARASAETAVRYDSLLFGFGEPVDVVVPPPSNTVAIDDARGAWLIVSWLQTGG